MGISPGCSASSPALPMQTLQTTFACFSIGLVTGCFLNECPNSRWERLPQKAGFIPRGSSWGVTWSRRVPRTESRVTRGEPEHLLFSNFTSVQSDFIVNHNLHRGSFIHSTFIECHLPASHLKITIKNKDRAFPESILLRYNLHTVQFTLPGVRFCELTNVYRIATATIKI